MTSAVDRLKRLTGEARPAPAGVGEQPRRGPLADPEVHPAPDAGRDRDREEETILDLRRRIHEILDRRPGGGLPAPPAPPDPVFTPLELEAVARGEEVETPHGRVFVAMGEVDAGEFWGRRRLREIDDLDMDAVALLAGDGRLASFAPADALYLDTETTGLAGGTGTLAFLIGLGWLDGGRFTTRLIFARDFTEEAAALTVLTRLAEGKRFLVTFNGKTFDLGLLAARFVLNRMADPLAGLPHLDLMHPSRRLLAHRLENGRLLTIEQAVLGLRRDGDIPGSEIPERYFRYLRTRDARLVAEVLEHNRLDVISMAALTVHLAELLGKGHETRDAEPADVVAAARLHLQRGNEERAERLLRGLLAGREEESRGEGGRELSLIAKRAGRWEEAVALWRRRIEANPFDLFALEEMAKWLEHRRGKFAEAIQLAERALGAPGLRAAAAAEGDSRAAWLHRLERLRRKRDGRPL